MWSGRDRAKRPGVSIEWICHCAHVDDELRMTADALDPEVLPCDSRPSGDRRDDGDVTQEGLEYTSTDYDDNIKHENDN